MNMIILKKNVEDFICPFLPFSISTLIYGVKFHCSNFIQGFYDLKKSPGEQFREQEVLAILEIVSLRKQRYKLSGLSCAKLSKSLD